MLIYEMAYLASHSAIGIEIDRSYAIDSHADGHDRDAGGFFPYEIRDCILPHGSCKG